MARPEEMWFVCPKCGASNLPGTEVCFLCGHRAESTWVPSKVAAPRSAAAHAQGGRGFRLDSLLLVIALIAVCMGVINEAPGLGVPLAVISFIAWARTAVYAMGEGKDRPLSVGDKLAVFFATVGVALIVVVCVVIALFATCFAICAVTMSRGGGVGLSGLSAFSVPLILVGAVGLLWLLLRAAGLLHRVRTGPRDRTR